MQLRYETGLTGEGYVRAQAWRDARLDRCPNHPHGECSLARHGTYARKTPRGTQIARWYCPESHMTFSLLPDCLAARLPGTLDEVEQVVAHAEQAPTRHARRVLCTPTLEPRYRHGRPRTMLSAEQMRSLPDVLRTITDPRSRYGRRYRLETVLVLAAAATLCGARGYKAIHEWVCDLSPAMLRHFRCRRVNGAYERPSIYCCRRLRKSAAIRRTALVN